MADLYTIPPALARAIQGVPSHMRDSTIKYLTHGYQPGGFMEAVLLNDLMRASVRADSANRLALHKWADVLYWMPTNAYGSPERIQQWMNDRRGADSNDG